MKLKNPFTGLTELQHITGTNARDSDGDPCDAESPRAVCWCAQGILYRGCSDPLLRQFDGFFGHLWIRTGKHLLTLNDVDGKPFSWFENQFNAWQETEGN